MQDKNFMSPLNIRTAILSLKLKNSEGDDRIPQRIILDGIDSLIDPFARLFSLIYKTKIVSVQWLIKKITPIHKKGSKKKLKIIDQLQICAVLQKILKD